jgi:hypothetical protein
MTRRTTLFMHDKNCLVTRMTSRPNPFLTTHIRFSHFRRPEPPMTLFGADGQAVVHFDS